MRLNLRLSDPDARWSAHVVVHADPETPIDDVVAALNKLRPGALFVHGYRLGGGGHLAGSGLLDGDVITVGRPGRALSTGGFQLAVVDGPAAGRSWTLPAGPSVVGRDTGASCSIDDPQLSRRHFRLNVSATECTIEDLGSLNGTRVDGEAVTSTSVGPGSLIAAGQTVLELRPAARGDADVRSDGAGGRVFNRPARIRPGTSDVRVSLPAPPAQRDPHPFPWVQVVAPIVLAVVVAGVLGRPEFLLFAFMGPVLAVSNAVSYRRRDAARSGQEQARYAAELAEAQSRITEAVSAEAASRREQFPDPASVAAIAGGPGRRLWERRSSDADAEVLRVGVADRPASVAVSARTGDRPPEPPVLPAVPVTVDLATAGVLGVAGPVGETRAVARWLITQLAALRSPRDLQVVVLTDGKAGADWEWLRWLPHARPEGAGAPAAAVGNDDVTREDRLRELSALLEERLAAAGEGGSARFSTSVVVVLDGMRALRELPGLPRILKSGPAVGIYAIGLDSDVTRLAEEGRAELVVDPANPARATLAVEGSEAVRSILVDRVDAAWADDVARALAPLRDGGGSDTRALLPDSVRYLDIVDVPVDDPAAVAEGWSRGGRTTRALLGVSADGNFAVDLRRDGPHALVAGTTGAGKSELLQTLVLSLALANPPSAVTFVLVDYKGASAFADCARLPHTVGLVTNLDGQLTERALASLDAELVRREQELARLGAKDVDTVWERHPVEAAAAGLARLVIVVDEFAELVRELPQFVDGLIRIARVGRSLGIHLILATQRPAGVVSPDMRANTGLRIALRMEDKHDSVEVLESPHAATIARSTPGRAFVRAGGRSGVVEFQTARVGGRRPGMAEAVPPPRVTTIAWRHLGYPLPETVEDVVPDGDTDLRALVEVIRRAAARVDRAKPRRPWLAPLPTTLVLPPTESPPDSTSRSKAVFGLEDVPAEQAQRPASFDVARGGHLLIAGSARSGRSTALRTLATSIARSMSPSDVHLYGLDFGNGALLALAELPHCGAVVLRSETERAERLVARLSREVTDRQALLARGGFGDIGEQRRRTGVADRLPYLVVLIDRWEGLGAQFPPESGSELPGDILRLVREGIGVGLRLVVAGDRSLLSDRLASLVDDKLVLALADRNDYRLVNLSPRSVPSHLPPGRALRADSGREVQIALLVDDPSAAAQAAAVAKVAEEAALRWPPARQRSRPFRVDALPSTIDFDEASALVDGTATSGSPLWALVAVGGDELGALGVDLARAGGFVVAGPPGSGRTTALMTMARSLAVNGAGLVVLCPRPSPLLRFAGTPGVVATIDGVPDVEALSTALGRVDGPVAVVIDDAEALARTPADDALKRFVLATTGARAGLLVAATVEDLKSDLRGTMAEARKGKAGLLLSPTSTLDGEVVGLRLPRAMLGRAPAGRGVLALDGDLRLVQVPSTSPPAPAPPPTKPKRRPRRRSAG
ncbi:MAG: FHA domain-containing protein [Actinobacteria bacterium]|nr:FHA domain-containing protein [Actinomycetota bacterium]